MLNVKQVSVIGAVVILIGLLYSLDIKGLVKEEGQHESEAAEQTSEVAHVITIETISEAAKQTLTANMSQQITDLEKSLQSASGAQKVTIQKQLAQKWEDVNQSAPAALYYQEISGTENTYANWLKTGDLFLASFSSSQDSTITTPLLQKASEAYQNALKLDPASLDAKTGLGVSYVNGAGAPMQGIQLLLEVVKEDPKNIKANTNLGLFSMRSGQFDKAVGRFKTVVEAKPDAESWFYLATSYENLNQFSDAIVAYEKSKELAADPDLAAFVDKKVQELKNK